MTKFLPSLDLQQRFSFRRVTETIYEIRPRGETGATDSPDPSKNYFPQTAEDTKKCPAVKARLLFIAQASNFELPLSRTRRSVSTSNFLRACPRFMQFRVQAFTLSCYDAVT